jgi:hypothetical protein
MTEKVFFDVRLRLPRIVSQGGDEAVCWPVVVDKSNAIGTTLGKLRTQAACQNGQYRS